MQITFAGRMRRFNGREPWGAESQLTIRTFESRDVESVFEIQSACPEVAQWSLWDYDRVTRGEMSGWVAEVDSKVAGFVIVRRVAADVEILNFAVRREFRRKGIGASLMQGVTEWGKSLRAEKAFLEVRASNAGAVSFYQKLGFRETGRRPRYYSAPIDDALLLTADLA